MIKLDQNRLRQHLEQQIAAVAGDIEILNRKIAEVTEYVKERDRLRNKMQDLTRQYLGECFREKVEGHKAIFLFNGKVKDLSEALQSQIRKAQNYSQF